MVSPGRGPNNMTGQDRICLPRFRARRCQSVPMTSLDKIEQAPLAATSAATSPCRRADRNAEARRPDRADATRADRDDDDRSGPDRAARRRGGCRRGAGAYGVLCRLHLRHGAGVGGGAAGGPGVRRPQPAHGTARAAGRAVGRAIDFAADDGCCRFMASRSCWRWARRPRPRSWRKNTCSDWYGA